MENRLTLACALVTLLSVGSSPALACFGPFYAEGEVGLYRDENGNYSWLCLGAFTDCPSGQSPVTRKREIYPNSNRCLVTYFCCLDPQENVTGETPATRENPCAPANLEHVELSAPPVSIRESVEPAPSEHEIGQARPEAKR